MKTDKANSHIDNDWSQFVITLKQKGATHFVDNVQTEIEFEKSSLNQDVPITINEKEYENSYVCSPYTAYISYAQEELNKINNFLVKFFLGAVIRIMSLPLKLSKINKIVFFNNWLLSTNLYSNLSSNDIDRITKKYLKSHPKHFLAWRSLNSFSNAKLIDELRASGYDLIASRQVYFFPKSIDFESHQNSKRDLKLLCDKKFNIQKITNADIETSEKIVELYNQLYLEKYSIHNPQFNSHYISLSIKSKAMTFYGLKDSQGEWQGVVGYFIKNGVMTTPIVGYNTSLPQSLGLYRRLIAIVLKDAKRHKINLNLSSGASKFKILRGGLPYIEYTAVYRKHLPKGRQIIIIFLKTLLTNIGIPVMKRLKL